MGGPLKASMEGDSFARRIIVLILANLIASTSVIIIRLSHTPPVLLAAGRLFGAWLFLMPFLRKSKKGYIIGSGKAESFRWTHLLPGIFLGLHFITWISSARMIPAASATLIINMVPLVLPFLLFFLANQKFFSWHILGTLIALGALILMQLPGLEEGLPRLPGILLGLGSMVLFSIYLTLAAKEKKQNFGSYMSKLYLIGGITTLCFLPFQSDVWEYQPDLMDGFLMILLIIGPTILGHMGMNWGMRMVAGQVVGLIQLTQVLWAGVLGFLIFNEIPRMEFFLFSPLIILGIIIALRRKVPVQP